MRHGVMKLLRCSTTLIVRLWMVVSSNFARHHKFCEAGLNFGLPSIAVANLTTRIQTFHGLKPFTPPCTRISTPPCTKDLVDDLRRFSGTGGVVAMRFTFCLAVGTPHPGRVVVQTEARQEKCDFRKFRDFRDRRTCSRLGLVAANAQLVLKFASTRERASFSHRQSPCDRECASIEADVAELP